MIGSLRGRLSLKRPPQIIVDCGGVGYEVETPMSTFLELPGLGADVQLFTHLQVREDAQTLFGFSSEAERTLFRNLLRVSGVGARMALSILSAMGVGDFARCVQHEDAATLTRIPGVGKKTAERLIIEMRDRLERSPAMLPNAMPKPTAGDARSEAYDALVTLGYKPAEVKRLLNAMQTDGLTAEDIIRNALRKAVN